MGMSIGNNYGGKVEVCGAVAVSHIEQPVMVIEHSELTPKLQIPAGLTMFSKSLKEKL